ncbi:MAG: hypothetical protein LBO62_02545 [Endomicrobium sp.]|jgi:hypothetical protein|nr:hypothetical protein [Endomicrobium sp.]
MYKSTMLFLTLLMCLLAFPAFAQEENAEDEAYAASALAYKSEYEFKSDKRAESELVIKAEAAPNGQINADGYAGNRTFNGDAIYGDKAGFALSAEYYYYAFKYLGAGAGVKYGFERKVDNFGSISVIDAYIALKPKIKIVSESRPDDKEAVYLIFQGGYGFFNKEITLRDTGGNIVPSKTESAWYYGAGFGVEFNGVIFEILFAVNELSVSSSEGSLVNLDAKYSMTNINIGYRFGFNDEEDI